MPDTIKPEQWPVQSQSTHRKCKGDKTSDKWAADMKQVSIWLANKARNKQPEQWPVQQPMYRIHANETTPMVYADDTGQIIM